VLALADSVWPSDETGPRDRLAIQHGFLTAYPPSVMSSWVTDERGRLDTRPVSLEFRFVVAMAGVLGIGADLLAWTEDERARARELVALYRDVRTVILDGEVRTHGNPADRHYALSYVAADRSRAVVLAYAQPGSSGVLRVPVPGLDADELYARRGGGHPMTGRELAQGVDVAFTLARDADVVVLERRA
jgi:alpha-galactosidase